MDLHLYFGIKDVDLILWKNSLPRGAFPKLIQAFFEAEINGTKPIIPKLEYKVPDRDNIKPYHIIIHLKNVVIEQYLKMIPSYQRNAVIKNVIRKNIQDKSYELFVPSPVTINSNENKKAKENKTKTDNNSNVVDIKINFDSSNNNSKSSKPIQHSDKNKNKNKHKNKRNNANIESIVSNNDEENENSTSSTIKSALLRMAGD